jgi:hypothetical protein
MPNYRPMFEFASGERVGNAQVFATHDEAWGSASNRFMRWTMPTDIGVDETDAPVNYTWTTDDGDVSLGAGEKAYED